MQFFPGERIRCLCDHVDPCEGELPFSKGEVLQVVAADLDANWLTAKNARGEEGSISTRYIERIHYEPLRRAKTDDSSGYSRQEYLPKPKAFLLQRPRPRPRHPETPLPPPPAPLPQRPRPQPPKTPLPPTPPEPLLLPPPRKPSGKQFEEDHAYDYPDAEPFIMFPKRTIPPLNEELVEDSKYDGAASEKMEGNNNVSASLVQDISQRGEMWTPGQMVECLSASCGVYAQDLIFSKGEILTIVSATKDKKMYVAKNNHGKEGMIQTNLVRKYTKQTENYEEIYDPPTNQSSLEEAWTPGQMVECISDSFVSYGVYTQDLSFSKGDILTIVSATQDKKLYVAKNIHGEEGLIRTNFVRKYAKQNDVYAEMYDLYTGQISREEILTPGQLVECMSDNGGLHEKYFSVSKGDILMIVEATSDKKWYLAKNVQGREGCIRMSSVRKHLDLLANQATVYALDGYASIRNPFVGIKSLDKIIQDTQLPTEDGVCRRPESGQDSETCVVDLMERFMTVLNKARREIHSVGGHVVEKAVACFRSAAGNVDELSMREGDVINIHNKELEEYGWWIGQNFGHIGAFPCTHVKIMKEVFYTPNEKVKCLVNFYGTSDQHLPFSRQEILTIISKQKNHQWYIAKNASGRRGLIPAHYIEKSEDLEAYTWFHGQIEREVCENLLQPPEDGMFLVRYSSLPVAEYILSVCCKERILHYLIRNDRYGLNIDGRRNFDTLAKLVEHYTKDANGLAIRLLTPRAKAGGLPPEILRMDENAQTIYREALAAGKEKVYNIRVMIVGHHGVGKTALTKRLLEEDISEEEREPTEGIDVHARCCQIDHDTGEWKIVKTETNRINDQRIVRLLQKHCSLQKGLERNTTFSRNTTDAETYANTDIQHDYLQAESAISNTKESTTDRVTKVAFNIEAHPSSSEQMNSPDSNVCEKTKDFKRKEQSNALPSPVDNVGLHTGIQRSLDYRIQCASPDSDGYEVIESVENESRKISDSPAENNIMGLDNSISTAEEIKQFVQCARYLSVSKSTISDVTMLDFAGHFEFYTTHQAFMSWRTLYILVTDIAMSLEKAVQDDKCDMDMSGDRTCSPLEYALYWLNAIHSHACLSSEHELSTSSSDRNTAGGKKSQQEKSIESPPVILVATHADKIPNNQLEQTKKTYFEKVRKAIGDRPLRFHLIDEDFAITNIRSDPGIDALKSKILDIAKRQDYWGEEVPARWLPLEQILMELKRQGVVIIDYTEVESHNESLQVKIESSEELLLFLRFEHDLGNIVYLSTEKLRSKIVLLPEWLINGLKVLIASEHIVKMYPELLNDWCNFKDTGRLAKRLLDVMWSQHSDYRDNQQHLLDLMEKLNIIAKPRKTDGGKQQDDYYWVPCMVHKTATDDVKTLGDRDDVKKTSTLCFRSKTKFIHVGVFHRLLASCVSKWSPAKEGDRYFLFSGFCVFELDESHNLILSLNDYVINVIMIRFSRRAYPDKSLCIKTRDYLQTTLSEIASCMCPNSEFEVCIKCDKSAPQSNEGLHPISSLCDNEEVRCSGHVGIHLLESSELLQYWEANDSQLPKNVLTTQSALATDRFMRIYSVVVDVGTKILRRLLHYYAVTPHCSLDQYLKKYTQIIFELKKKKVLNQSQISIIFPQSGDTDIRQYDITLLSALLNNIVPALGQTEKQRVVDLRSDRNTIMHANSTRLRINDFQSMWTRITTTLTDLSKLCGDSTFEEEIKTEIQDIQTSASSDILSRIDSVEEELKQMRSDVVEIKKHCAQSDQGL